MVHPLPLPLYPPVLLSPTSTNTHRFFIVSAPILILVLAFWYITKHTLATSRQNPLRRGVYEALYHELATTHSTLWSRSGPRNDVVTAGLWSGIKWRLLTGWFPSDKIVLGGSGAKNYDPGMEDMGTWSRLKRHLARRWLGELAVVPVPRGTPQTTTSTTAVQSYNSPMHKEEKLGAVGKLVGIATPVAIAELDPTAASRLQKRGHVALSPKGERPHSRASSDGGVMVEEKESEEGGD
jgi:hypothetical protein